MLLLLLVAGGGVAAFFWQGFITGKKYYSGIVGEAKIEKLQLRIIERGELESAANSDIKCKVKGKKGMTIKIKWVIEDGQPVKRGQKLIELDATPLKEALTDQEIKVAQAKAAWVAAKEEYKITESQNKSDILAAEVAKDVAKLELEGYEKGDYVNELNDLLKDIKDTQAEVKQWQKRYSWTLSMYYRKYFSPVQVDSEKAKKDSAELKLKNLLIKKQALEDFKYKKMIREYEGKVAEAALALERAKSQALAKIAQADSKRKTEQSILRQEQTVYDELEEDIGNCIITAPRDGLVIYHIPEQSRFNRGSSQSIVAPGEPVDYDRKMMQIPDLSEMQVKATIHEAMVKYLRNADPAHPGSWQPAVIRVSAFPGRVFNGHVESVATIASSQDFLSSDVRVYKTIIAIDDKLEQKQLKPGMSAEITIIAYETPQPVVTIPIQAVVGNITMGSNRKCYVIAQDGSAELRDIEIGLSNERIVEVKSGLNPGDRVALDPTPLLPRDGSLRPAQPGGDRRDTGDGVGGKRGGKRGKGGGRGGMPGGKGGARRGNPQVKQGGPGAARGDEKAQKAAQVNQVPEADRGKARKKLQSQGLEVAD